MAKWFRFDPDADRRLARALSEGGEDSLAALYDIYAAQLSDYCTSLIREPHTAPDIVHDTLIDAARRARRMRDRVRLRAWLYGAVRRRCLQRVRHPVLHWDWGGRPDDETALETGDKVRDEAGQLLEAAFDRLDFIDQEALLLALRHDLTADDLGAMLGIPPRRASARVARAKARAESALAGTQRTLARRCTGATKAANGNSPTGAAGAGAAPTVPAAAAKSGGDGSDTAEPDLDGRPREPIRPIDDETAAPEEPKAVRPPADNALSEHITACEDCTQRGGLPLAALLDLMPAPELPTTLRHRVIHTGTDPELAGYRADIAARGGALNADGLPRQPDIPSYFARRWLFAGGGIVGALTAALVAAFLIGPGASAPDLVWPSYQPQPSTTTPVTPPQQQQPQQPVAPPSARPGQRHPGSASQMDQSQISGPSATSSSGIVAVSPDAVTLTQRENTAKLTLSAVYGPITWRAMASTDKITLSADHGRIPAGDMTVITIAFKRDVLQLPGSGTITITDAMNRGQVVTVSWQGSLL